MSKQLWPAEQMRRTVPHTALISIMPVSWMSACFFFLSGQPKPSMYNISMLSLSDKISTGSPYIYFFYGSAHLKGFDRFWLWQLLRHVIHLTWHIVIIMAATSVFQRVRTGSKIGAQYDQEGNLIKVALKTKHLNSHVCPFAFADSFFVFKVMH